MINELTPTQLARLETFKVHTLSTQPADRLTSEAALNECYKHAGLDFPKVIVWAQSPIVACFAGAIAANQLEGGRVRKRPPSFFLKDQLDPRHRFTTMVFTVADKVLDKLVPKGRGIQNANFRAIEGAVSKIVSHKLRAANVTSVITALDQETSPEARKAASRLLVRTQLALNCQGLMHRSLREAHEVLDPNGTFTRAINATAESYIGGPDWEAPATYERFFACVCKLELPGDLSKRGHHWAKLIESCGWVWPHADFAICTDRPYGIDVKPRLQLHFRDEWSCTSR
jgi:hypothetical protein